MPWKPQIRLFASARSHGDWKAAAKLSVIASGPVSTVSTSKPPSQRPTYNVCPDKVIPIANEPGNGTVPALLPSDSLRTSVGSLESAGDDQVVMNRVDQHLLEAGLSERHARTDSLRHRRR